MRRTTCAKLSALVLLPLAAVTLPGCGDDGSTIPPDVRGTIEVVNQTIDLHVFSVEPRSCGTTTWDLDLLPDSACGGSGCIAPSQSRRFTVEAGCYDFRAELFDMEVQGIVATDSILDFLVVAGETSTWNINVETQPPEPE